MPIVAAPAAIDNPAFACAVSRHARQNGPNTDEYRVRTARTSAEINRAYVVKRPNFKQLFIWTEKDVDEFRRCRRRFKNVRRAAEKRSAGLGRFSSLNPCGVAPTGGHVSLWKGLSAAGVWRPVGGSSSPFVSMIWQRCVRGSNAAPVRRSLPSTSVQFSDCQSLCCSATRLFSKSAASYDQRRSTAGTGQVVRSTPG